VEKDLASTIAAALTASIDLSKIPKSVVDCYVMIMEAGGAEAAVAITAASLAIADAGLEMFDLVPACSVVSGGGGRWGKAVG
jgi:exosome complex component MTR3